VKDTVHRQGNRSKEWLILMIIAVLGGVDNLIYVDHVATKKVLLSVIIGGMISGTFVGLIGLKVFGLVSLSLTSITIFTDVSAPMYLMYSIISSMVSFASLFIFVLHVLHDEKNHNKSAIKRRKIRT